MTMMSGWYKCGRWVWFQHFCLFSSTEEENNNNDEQERETFETERIRFLEGIQNRRLLDNTGNRNGNEGRGMGLGTKILLNIDRKE